MGAGASAALIRVKLSRGAFRSHSPILAVQPRSLEADGAMSALGQLLTFECATGVSASPPRADMLSVSIDVR